MTDVVGGEVNKEGSKDGDVRDHIDIPRSLFTGPGLVQGRVPRDVHSGRQTSRSAE